jgi:hypothetical protein
VPGRGRGRARARARRRLGDARLRYDLPSGGARVDTLDNELDRLYGLDPADFVGERDRIVRELRDAGRREEAEQVKSLRKPTVSAWAINQLARRERRDVDLLLDAGHRLREAQQGVLAGKDRTTLDEARETEREALSSLRDAAGSILAEAGSGGEPALNRVMQTLQASAVSAEGRELLARGRFTGDLEATGFELLAPLTEGKRKRAAPKKTPARRQAPPRNQQRERLEAARGRLREARAAARAAQQEFREAGREASKTRRELTKAEEQVEKKEAAAAEAQDAVAQAEQELREAEKK